MNVNRTHHLKTHPSQYRSAEIGVKHFEFRKNDRDFEVGDTLSLHYFDPSPKHMPQRSDVEILNWEQTKADYMDAVKEQHEQDARHKPLLRKVTHILHGGLFGVPVGYCVMSVVPTP